MVKIFSRPPPASLSSSLDVTRFSAARTMPVRVRSFLSVAAASVPIATSSAATPSTTAEVSLRSSACATVRPTTEMEAARLLDFCGL
jgi:hypothetical protein